MVRRPQAVSNQEEAAIAISLRRWRLKSIAGLIFKLKTVM